MQILTIDLGMTRTGISIFVDGELRSLGYIKFPGTVKTNVEFLRKMDLLNDVIRWILKGKPDIVLVEDAKAGFIVTRSRVDRTAKGYAFNMFFQWRISSQCPCVPLSESTVRKFLGINKKKGDPEKGAGSAKKIAFRKAVDKFEDLNSVLSKKQFKKRTGTPADVAFDMIDAYVLGRYWFENEGI